MFENIIAKTINYIKNGVEYLKDATMYMFYEYFGLSTGDLRLIALILILTTFTFLIITTFIIYLRSLVSLVKNTSNSIKELPKVLETLQIGYEDKSNKEKIQKENIKVKPSYNYNIGLILDMISRGVTEFKASQAIMMKAKDVQSQENILQVVSSIKEFTSLCKQGVFKNTLKDGGANEKTAFEDIVKGDISTALELIFALMEKEVRRVEKIENKKKKEAIFKRLSDTTCLFGNLANLKDPMLAAKCFEMAVELDSQNIRAWSRTADIYYETSHFDKAEWIYKKILKEADKNINQQQIANANIMLSKYYYEQENVVEAQKLYNIGSPYYEEMGIGTDLNEREKDVLEFIEENQIANINKTVSRLLGDIENFEN